MYYPQDRDRLRKELQDMKNAALRIVKDSPELHYKMGLVFNHSGSHSPPAEDQAGGKGGVVGGLNEEEEDKGEEVLLSDEVMDTLARDLGEHGEGRTLWGGREGVGWGGGGGGGGGEGEGALLSDEVMDTLARDLGEYGEGRTLWGGGGGSAQ